MTLLGYLVDTGVCGLLVCICSTSLSMCMFQVAPVKRIVTSSVGVQTDKTEEIDRPQPVKHFYSDEQVETGMCFMFAHC